jgi:fatty-acyl-CoA synthase
VTSWNYAEVFEGIARTQPAVPAIIQGERTVTWGQFEERSRGVATWLWGRGLARQDKIALYLYNCAEYLETVFASFRAGLVPVNTNYRYGAEELAYLWDNADTAAVVFHGAFTETIESLRGQMSRIGAWLWVDDGTGPCPAWATPYEDAAGSPPAALDSTITRTPDDLLLLYTGGTTGAPKGVMWRQDDHLCRMNSAGFRRWNLEGTIDQILETVRTEGPGDRQLLACPLMHGTGLYTALEALVEAGSVVLLEGRHYDPAAMAADIDRFGVDVVIIVGDPFARPLLEALDAAPGRYSLASVKVMLSSGAMWSEEVKHGLLAHQPAMLLVDTIGSTEAIGMGKSVSRPGREKRTGEFRINADVRVIDESGHDVEPGSEQIGVIALGGRNPLGYYKDEAKSASTFKVIDGRRYSVPGDYATVRADGTVQLLGRGNQCINTAGEKVFPEEVEEVLKRHEAVVDACVVGIPDRRTGERVVAAVELEQGSSVGADELIEHVRAHLAHYKAPRAIRFVETIGRSPAGKMDYSRHKAEAMAWAAGTPA